MSSILSMVTDQGVFLADKVNTEDEVYKSWKEDAASLSEYLRRAISMDWIDITKFDTESKYSDSTEIYDALIDYIMELLPDDLEFNKRIYK